MAGMIRSVSFERMLCLFGLESEIDCFRCLFSSDCTLERNAQGVLSGFQILYFFGFLFLL